MLLGLFAAQPAAVRQTVTRLIVQDEVILRVPVQPRPMRRQIEWIEQKGPKCIPAGAIRARFCRAPSRSISCSPTAAAFARSSTRIARRSISTAASISSRRTSGYARGRDAIHSRMGGSCTIERFKLLDAETQRE